jgi:hypothetical protein
MEQCSWRAFWLVAMFATLQRVQQQHLSELQQKIADRHRLKQLQHSTRAEQHRDEPRVNKNPFLLTLG